MLQRNKIKYAPSAADDMDEIFSYISKENAAAAAEIMLEKISNEIIRLAEFPNMGSVLSDEEYALIHRRYRFIVIQAPI